MWRFTKPSAFYLGCAGCLLMFSCANKHQKNKFSKQAPGYYYSLLDFNSDSTCHVAQKIAHVTATFKTQDDSVFWDSHNNQKDNLFIEMDSTARGSFFKRHVALGCLADSFCLLVPVKAFFLQQFASDSIPFFSRKDSVVKINFKITELFTLAHFKTLVLNFKSDELQQIKAYFKTPENLETSLDPLGFYWINRPAQSKESDIEYGDQVTLTYSSQFLNGRFFEKSVNHFEFIYGTPDQLLKGLNYVIGSLKFGQTAKILLPSRLAFGESGSSTGIVAPYTPLIYEVQIIDVKKQK